MTVRDRMKQDLAEWVAGLDGNELIELYELYASGRSLACETCKKNQGGKCKMYRCPPAAFLLNNEYKES